MRLNTLSPAEGSKKAGKRLGRGCSAACFTLIAALMFS